MGGSMSGVSVRSATLDDAEPLLVIYRPFVLNTAISFEREPPSVAEFRGRIERSLGEWAWLVAERDRRPVGYAYATPHRSRGAYKWSVEPSVYVDEGSHRQGIGRMLYEALPHFLLRRDTVTPTRGSHYRTMPAWLSIDGWAFRLWESFGRLAANMARGTMSHGGIFAYVRNLRMSSGAPNWRMKQPAIRAAAYPRRYTPIRWS